MRRVDKLHRLMVVIEGPRGVGKLTLAQGLRRRYDEQLMIMINVAGYAYVHDDLVNRPLNERRNYLAELGFIERGFDVRQVILLAPPLVCARRLEDEAPELIDSLKIQLASYQRWAGLSKRFVTTHEVWTTHLEPEALTEGVGLWLDSTLDTRTEVSNA